MVENEEMQVAIREACGVLNHSTYSTYESIPRIRVKLYPPNSEASYENSVAFLVIINTIFEIGVRRMLKETLGFEGRKLTSIDLFVDEYVDINFNF